MIPVCEPELGKEELRNVVDCIKKKMISGTAGNYLEEFEKEFSKFCGVKYGVATTSGTTALHLAIESLGIGKGSEVIVPTLTNAATVFAIIYSGAKPVLVDSEPKTWNIDPDGIAEKVTKNTRAILPVHLYGHPADMKPILDIAEDYDLYIIEDAAEAHGAEYKGRKVGSLGDVGCFSFYANKIITTGEGGMMVTNNKKIAERAKLLRNLAFSRRRHFLHHHIGFNYRMTNIQAAIGVAQLRKIDKFIEKKRQIARWYNSLLKNIDGIALPREMDWAKNVYWMYSILIEEEFGMSRDVLMKKLRERGIETRPFFIPMHQQPIFKKMGLFKGEKYPIAEELSKKGLYLPSGVGLTKKQVEYVCDSIKEIHEIGDK